LVAVAFIPVFAAKKQCADNKKDDRNQVYSIKNFSTLDGKSSSFVQGTNGADHGFNPQTCHIRQLLPGEVQLAGFLFYSPHPLIVI
jgi:hypothetical protein